MFCKTIMKAAAVGVLGSSLPASGEPGSKVGELQLIVVQEEGRTVGLNIAHGRGEDVRFYSNIAESDIVWTDEAGGVRSGQYEGELEHVQLGVCAGTNCQAATGFGFTTEVGGSLR